MWTHSFLLLPASLPEYLLSCLPLNSLFSEHSSCLLTLKMEPMSWSLNFIDKMFLTLMNRSVDPFCPGGTFAAENNNNLWGDLSCLWRMFTYADVSERNFWESGLLIYLSVSDLKTWLLDLYIERHTLRSRLKLRDSCGSTKSFWYLTCPKRKSSCSLCNFLVGGWRLEGFCCHNSEGTWLTQRHLFCPQFIAMSWSEFCYLLGYSVLSVSRISSPIQQTVNS